jgi:D-alanine-D-alanine ligase
VLKPGGWILLDVADGKAVKEHFTPNAWHEIGDDILVCRQRELKRDYICAREIVIKKSAGLVRDRNYGMKLYGSESLMELIQTCGFKKAKAHRDFSPLETEDDLGFES